MEGEYLLRGVFCKKPLKLLRVPVLQKLNAFHRQSCTRVELNRNSSKFCVFEQVSAGKIRPGTINTAKSVLSGEIAAADGSGTVPGLS